MAAGSAMGKEGASSDAQAAAFAATAKRTHIVYHIETTESQEPNAKVAFEIKDFSFGVENPTTIGSATGGAGAGKIKFNEFTIKKTTDKTSPAFYKNCATGSHYKSVIIEMRKVSDKNESSFQTLQVYSFETVFTTKIDWSGPGDEGPEESITFVFGKLGIKYIDQTTGETTQFGWDQVSNTRDDE